MLNEIAKAIGGQSITWQDDIRTWGEQVALYREYERGDHRADMTPEMRRMLRIADNRSDAFNANYCELVVSAMADRLEVERIEAVGGEDAAQARIDNLLAANRFDGLQMDVHEATIRDGDTFVMLDYDEDRGMVRLHHEPAFDGDTGVVPVYDRMNWRIIGAAKIWLEADDRRMNIYLPDVVRKYTISGEESDGGATLIKTVPWLPGVVPVVHFRNRGKTRQMLGRSELKMAIPLQDALNRNLVSMVMTAELSAFQIRTAIGFVPPADVAPGMWIIAGGDEGVNREQVVEIGTLDQASLVPFIDQANYLIEQIATVTKTPMASMMGGDSQSGEALKQRESGLLGKIRRFQTRIGNSWEDVITLADAIQAAYGVELVPAAERYSSKWRDAQVRNEGEIVSNALALRDVTGDREVLRRVGYGAAEIEQIMQEKAAEAVAGITQMSLPGFEQFDISQIERQIENA